MRMKNPDFKQQITIRAARPATLALALSLGYSLSMQAQTSLTLNGTVQDPSGALIPHARVSVLSSGGKLLKEQFTDAQGQFNLGQLPEARYTLQVTEVGFREFSQTLTRASAVKAPFVITLQVRAEEIAVDVESSDSSSKVNTDIASNQNAIALSRDALDHLPVFDADYITTLSRFLDQDSLATSGLSLVVNGVEANGPGVTASAVSNVKVNQNPYSVLFARPGRARLELQTEGGTPHLHGTVNYLERDAVFDAKPAFAVTRPPERRDYVEGSLTGPLTQSKKATFLVSGQYDDDETQAIVLAALPGGALNENVPNPVRHVFVSGRAFRDYGESNEFWAGYSYERERYTNLGVGGTVLPEAGSDELSYEHEINVQDRYVISPKLVNTGHFLVGHNLERIRSNSETPQLNVPGSFTRGGAQADTLRTESHFDGTDVLTYSSGKHTVTAGIDIPDISRRGNDDLTDRQGTYSFDDLQHYEAQTPFQYIVQTGPGHVTFVEKVVAGFLADDVRISPRLSVDVGARYYFQNYFNDVRHNVAPRVSFAFAPSAKSTTIVRGGAGVFFDRTGSTPIADLLHYNGSNIARYIVTGPIYPVTPTQVSATTSSLVKLDPRTRIPYTLQYGVSLEQQITAKSTATVSYLGSRGIDLFRSLDANAPLPPSFAISPDPSLGQVRQIQSEGYMKSDSLELAFRGEPTRYFTGQVQYLLSKTYNNTSGIRSFPANSYDPDAEWARSDNDARNKVNLLGTVHASHGLDLGIAFSARTELPVDITTGDDANNDGVINDRHPGTPRNSLHGPGYVNFDLDLSREFRLSRGQEGPRVSASLSSFNVLNHQNDTTYIGVSSSPFFGTAVAAQPSRRMQLSMQLKF